MPTILVVDDIPAIRTAMSRLLGSGGYTVWQASNGRDALSNIDIDAVDLIISDVDMPEMNGKDFSRSVKESFPDTPMILVTAGSNPEAVARETGIPCYDKLALCDLELLFSIVKGAVKKP